MEGDLFEDLTDWPASSKNTDPEGKSLPGHPTTFLELAENICLLRQKEWIRGGLLGSAKAGFQAHSFKLMADRSMRFEIGHHHIGHLPQGVGVQLTKSRSQESEVQVFLTIGHFTVKYISRDNPHSSMPVVSRAVRTCGIAEHNLSFVSMSWNFMTI
jgi:hypothetical protein